MRVAKDMKYNNRAGWGIGLSLIVFFVVLLPSIALAYTAVTYSLPNSFTVGTLMAISDDSKPVAATVGSNYIGVVTGQTNNSVEIADSGIVHIFVLKNDSRSITNGSKIGISPVAGIAALSQGGEAQIGVANENITASSSRWKTIAIKMDNETLKRDVQVALVEVSLSRCDCTLGNYGGLIGSVQLAACSIVGHSVALWQVVLAVILGVGGFVFAFGLILVSNRKGILSIERTPMDRKSILSGMWGVSAISIAVMIAGLIAAYLIIKIGGIR